jgi:hypothetical protein
VSAPVSTGFGATPSASPFDTVVDAFSSFAPTVASGFGGKDAPAQPPHPEK